VTEIRVRQLVPVGAHIDADGQRVLNRVGDEYLITDAYLDPKYLTRGGPGTVEQLVQGYVDAGLVEVIE